MIYCDEFNVLRGIITPGRSFTPCQALYDMILDRIGIKSIDDNENVCEIFKV